ncbi:hypothetical protein DYI42_00305 [Vannielia litorea]|nr:hypothetical protein [Vannielia litorea]
MLGNTMRQITGIAATLLVSVSAMSANAQDRMSAGIGSTAQGSFAYTSAAAIAKTISEQSPLQMRVQPMTGSSVYLGLLDSGELAFAVNSGPDLALAYRGKEPFMHNPGLRLIGAITRFDAAFIVRADSPYQTLEDAKGARLAGGYPSHLISLLFTTGALAAQNMSEGDFDIVPVPNSGSSLQALKENAVDIAFSTINNSGVQETAAAVGGVRYLPVIPEGDAEAVARFQAEMPGTVANKRMAGAVPGVDQDMTAMGWDLYFTTGAKTDADMVYTATKTFWEKIDSIRGAHAVLEASLNREYFLQKEFDVPYHEGAVRFFKEVGAWTDEMDARQAELLALSQ